MGKLEGKTALVTGGNGGIGLATAKSGRKDGAGLARFTERFAKVNGVRLRYLIGGQGSAVVLLHGYAETGHMWRPIMPSLAERTPSWCRICAAPEARPSRRPATTRRRWRSTSMS